MSTRERTTSSGISVAILCGGMSRRFGTEKALEKAGERPLCHWLLERLSSVTDDLFLQMAPGATAPADLPAHLDPTPGGGPKSGIHGALLHARYPRVFVVGSDMPNVDPRLPLVLSGHEGADAVVPRWENGWIEPLCALYSSTALPTLVSQLSDGRLRMRDLLDELGSVIYVTIEPLVDAGDLDANCFVNINTRDELDRWTEMLSGASLNRGGHA
jgi:molybdopterin-guanine dinucleotide biosynthesis protein A